jgi:hypothetical protein
MEAAGLPIKPARLSMIEVSTEVEAKVLEAAAAAVGRAGRRSIWCTYMQELADLSQLRCLIRLKLRAGRA